jgi:very-short-patch-repair endonuclease
MSRSKLEEALAGQLALMGMDERWPYPAPIREMHPMWCCEHSKVFHHRYMSTDYDSGPFCAACMLDTTHFRRHEYAKGRNWRCDFVWPSPISLIVECEGINFSVQGGRHQTGAGFQADLEKYNSLRAAGWDVIRVGQREISSGVALSLIESALKERTKVEA